MSSLLYKVLKGKATLEQCKGVKGHLNRLWASAICACSSLILLVSSCGNEMDQIQYKERLGYLSYLQCCEKSLKHTSAVWLLQEKRKAKTIVSRTHEVSMFRWYNKLAMAYLVPTKSSIFTSWSNFLNVFFSAYMWRGKGKREMKNYLHKYKRF